MNTQEKDIQDGRFVDVLVVDDDTETVEELVEFLSKAKLKCAAAHDAWQALELLAEGWRPSVVVTDLRMPELSGMEFAERLAGFSGAERPEIIFVSGNAGFDDAIAAIRLGARDMLTKPIDGQKLIQTVKSAQIARQLRMRVPESSSTSGGKPEPAQITRKREALNDMKSLRRLRTQHFPSDLFSDPCWEMLLDLYDAHLAGAEVTVTSLGAASGVPQTTALRRMETLQGHGLITRSEDKDDKRRTIIKLTDPGLAAVERFFENYLSRRAT
jgi:CheY-like chemotaxis protein/DNA-binding MarR family transcriptional regulator